jgi:hypothetical protein
MENEKSLMVADFREVAITQEPDIVIQEASKAANALKKIVDGKKKKFMLNGEQYIEFEDWQTVGKFYGLSARATRTALVQVGEVRGYEADAEVIHVVSGQVVSRAEAMCLNDEPNWKGKPLFQLRSMAQTRACAKAFRNCLSWVVVLAGYKTTPAEELDHQMAQEKHEVTDRTQHYCSEHNIPFFKKGKMKTYAHKIEGTDTWCNEPEEEVVKEHVGTLSAKEQAEMTGTPKCTPDQIAKLESLKKSGVDLKVKVVEYGWKAEKIGDLTTDQADRLIKELGQ